MAKHFMEFAFTDSVRKVQEKYGTRTPYQKMQAKNEFRNKLTWQETGYIQNRDSFYMSFVGENGWPPVSSEHLFMGMRTSIHLEELLI